MLTPGQCKNKYQKRASKRECVTYWLQGNSAKHLITAVPGNLNLSKRIQCSQCLIAVDGCWSVMHDNVCVTLLPAYVHSCQPSLQVMSRASLTRGERERERKKKSPHRHKATCTQITQATGIERQKWTAKASFYQPLYSSLFMLKTKQKTNNKKTYQPHKNKIVASATNSIPTGKSQVPVCLIICSNTCLGLHEAIWITIR